MPNKIKDDFQKGCIKLTKSKEKNKDKKAQLIRLTSSFSKQFLNEEYDVVIEKLINKMARKREVPFLRGKIEIWAAAIIHAVGSINFLFDKSTKPYISVAGICEFFQTNQSTTTQRSKQIRDMFRMTYFDQNFSIKTIEQKNPFNHLTMVDHFIVPNKLQPEKFTPKDKLEDWELIVAEIIGVTLSDKEFTKEEWFHSMLASGENLIKFLNYIEQHMQFPFPALLEQETGPRTVTEYEVICFDFGQEIVAHDRYGILMECILEGKKVTVPLAEFMVDPEHPNFPLIYLYLNWFWNYR